MTPLAANTTRPSFHKTDVGHGPVDGGSILYGNAVLQANALGFLIPCATNPDLPLVGVNKALCDNSAGSDGDATARYWREYEGMFPKSGTIDETDIGNLVSFIDDTTVKRALGLFTSGTGVANSAFTLTSKVKGARIGFALVERGASGALVVEVSGGGLNWQITVQGKTTAGSAQDSLASKIKTAIEAHTQANALVTMAYQAGHSGAGKPAAIPYGVLALPGPVARCTGIDGSLVKVKLLPTTKF